MKKLFVAAAALMISAGAFAQTETGNIYVETQMSAYGTGAGMGAPGMDLNFGDDLTNFSIGANAGYFVIDNLAINLGVGFGLTDNDGTSSTTLNLSVGARYYFAGIIPVGVNYNFAKTKDVDGTSGVNFEAGYAWFITDKIALQPMVYYNLPVGDDSPDGRFGVKVGFGYYF